MMITTNDKENQFNVSEFAKKTYREVTIWDWLGRILPLTVLAALTICYFFKWHSVIELILEISSIVFFVVCFIWWYWAIYKIAVTARYMSLTQEKFKQLAEELRRFKKDLPKNDSNRKRGES